MGNITIIDDIWCVLDESMHDCVTSRTFGFPPAYAEMILYQLGWDGSRFDNQLTGKRIRPLILLLTTNALGGEWRQAIPAAVAIELIHNFSLVHDDIQDRSQKRRGRDTVWVKYGEAQAINTGDAILALANLSLLELTNHYLPQTVHAASKILHQATFDLTRGQFMDLMYEKAEEVNLNDYWRMVEGKTSALFSASFTLGALLAEKTEIAIANFFELGRKVGLAFQVQDDYLGIWGMDEVTGKSAESDLLDRKKTFPVQFALENLPEIRDYWISHNPFSTGDVTWIKEKLLEHGIQNETLAIARNYYEDSLNDLALLVNYSDRSKELTNLVTGLFSRMK